MAKEVKYFESDIKALLIQFLMEKNILSEDSIIINELTVDNYARRADIVLLKKNELHAYEIKSDADSLVRLDGQISKYLEYFDKVTVVVTRKHTEKALLVSPAQVGVIELSKDKFKIIRRGKKITNKRKDSFISLMTSVELRTLASKVGLATTSYKRKDLEKAMELVTLKQLREHAILCLKKKYSRQFDKFSEETGHRVVKSTDISLLSVHKRASNYHKGIQNIKDIINNLYSLDK
ncbi:sce7726 family protein [Aeromonas encheleia]|uniref:Sce7726 family protein n=1 Tax=Aeromonas encheleia TaxID=73010 RepID=A0AAE9MHD4_9GAMM|nr:sce7726 family protein [Aeromonas encheleia]USV57746.1 sce7726 family protein [Aeromonas encheleia]